MKNQFILILLFFSISTFCQANKTRDLALEISSKDLTMSELVSLTNEKFKDSTEKAKFIYYWMGFNINYDYKLIAKKQSISLSEYQNLYSYNHYPAQVFIKRTGVCYGYSKLFKYFMDKFGIETEIITGHIRDERNHYVELESDFDYTHAWNVIKLKGKWILVDTTWGTSLNQEVADFYFDIPPKRAVITHFPEKSEWQLLERPLSLEEFNNSVYVNPIWFKVGFSDVPKLKMDYKYYYLIFKTNPNKKWITNLLYSVDNKTFQQLKNSEKFIQDELIIIRFYKSIVPKKVFFKVNLHVSFDGKESQPQYSDVINFKM